jgi:hypothetical protein
MQHGSQFLQHHTETLDIILIFFLFILYLETRLHDCIENFHVYVSFYA